MVRVSLSSWYTLYYCESLIRMRHCLLWWESFYQDESLLIMVRVSLSKWYTLYYGESLNQAETLYYGESLFIRVIHYLLWWELLVRVRHFSMMRFSLLGWDSLYYGESFDHVETLFIMVTVWLSGWDTLYCHESFFIRMRLFFTFCWWESLYQGEALFIIIRVSLSG